MHRARVITMAIALLVWLAAPVAAPVAAPAASSPPKVRPYTGIGILTFSNPSPAEEPLYPLYEDPGLARIGLLAPGAFPGNAWIFGEQFRHAPVIVTGRKDAWLKVVYDDAGREGWLKPGTAGSYQPWEQFLKSRMVTALPGIQKKYLQLYHQPGGVPLAPLTARQAFRVVRLEQDWALVVPPDQGTLGWLRWRDEDGRLLFGIVAAEMAALP